MTASQFKVIQFLKEHTLEDLKQKYAVKSIPHEQYPNVYLLHYQQTASPMNEEIVQECRGLILEKVQEHEYKIIAFPYLKFFNYNEVADVEQLVNPTAPSPSKAVFPKPQPQEQDFDWEDDFKVYEKYDGSFAMLYYYNGEWQVSSSGTPDGRGKIGFTTQVSEGEAIENGATTTSNSQVKSMKQFEEDLRAVEEQGEEGTEQQEATAKKIYSRSELNQAANLVTFRDAFWNIWKKSNFKLPTEEDGGTNYCFMFEMLTTKHIIVVQHAEDSVILHGARNLTTFQEEDPLQLAEKYNWRVAQPMYSASQVLSLIEQGNDQKLAELSRKDKLVYFLQSNVDRCDPTKSEGYVLCDSKFNRLKLKNKLYIKLSHLMFDDEKATEKNMYYLLQKNEGSEFLAYFPKYQQIYLTVKHVFDRICTLVDGSFEALSKSPSFQDVKLFAKETQQLKKTIFHGEKTFEDVLFKMKREQKSARECFTEMQPSRFIVFMRKMKPIFSP